MVSPRRSAPYDLCEKHVGNRVSGLFFLTLAGGAFFLAWSGVLELPPEMADFPLEPIGSLFGAILTYMGLSALLTLRGVRVDLVEKTIRRFRRGLFGRRYEPEVPLAELDHVRLRLEAWGTGSRKRTFHAVSLRLTSGEQLEVLGTDLFHHARQTAERFARELSLDLHDETDGGEAIIRRPDELDTTVRDKLREGRSSRPLPRQPFAPRATVHHGTNVLTIDIPRFAVGQLGPMQKALWILMAVLGGGIVASYYWRIEGVALFCVPVFLVFSYLLLRSETIVVTGDALAVSTGIGPARIKRSIPIGELENCSSPT